MALSVCSHASTLTDLEQILSSQNKGVNTDAVIIYKDGQKIFESHGREYHPERKHLSWSMAKTFTGILIGQAIEGGRISLDDEVRSYLPLMHTKATIKNVLQMSSGISFKEEYTGIPVNADVTRMLYLNGSQEGFAEYVSALPAREEFTPGNHFFYSSGDTNLLMNILKKVSASQEEYNDLPWQKIFRPLGIEKATFEQDSSGSFVGSSYVYLSSQDYLKIGQLLMQDGVWGDVQVIPKHYMDLMKEVAPGVNLMALEGTSPTRAYSSQVTTNKPIPGRNLPSEYPSLPVDSLLMIGHQGQLVVASPSQKMVIVRLATDKGTSFDRQGFFKLASQLIREKGLALETASDVGPTPIAPKKKDTVKISDYLKVPHLIRALAAKEYCSCRLVVGRSDGACKADLKVSLPVLPKLKIEGHKVSAVLGTGILKKISVAEFRGEKLGCSLIQSK